MKFISQEAIKALSEGKLKEIVIARRSKFSEEDVEEFFKSMEGFWSGITHLSISECCMKDEAAIKLAKRLKCSEVGLSSLDISVNSISFTGLDALMDVDCLTFIDCSANEVNDSIMPKILKREPKKVVLLDGNPINEGNLLKISEHFLTEIYAKENQSVPSASFWGNKSDPNIDENMRVLESALSILPRLHLSREEKALLKERFSKAIDEIEEQTNPINVS